MDKFLEAAAIAWNPIGEVRRRMEAGTLTARSTLVPFVGIVVACNLFAGGVQKWFWDSVASAAGGAIPDHPLMKETAQRLLSALGVLVPAGAVSLLPVSFFRPPGRSATVASILVVASAWAFYGAAIGVPVHLVAGTLAAVDVDLALRAYVVLVIAAGGALAILVLSFWLRIALSVLELRGGQVFGISSVALVAGLVLAGMLLLGVSAATR